MIKISNRKIVDETFLCQAKIKYPPEFRGRNKHHGEKCGKSACYKILNHYYCKRHAQEIALQIIQTLGA